jgi:hypothetical protein
VPKVAQPKPAVPGPVARIPSDDRNIFERLIDAIAGDRN